MLEDTNSLDGVHIIIITVTWLRQLIYNSAEHVKIEANTQTEESFEIAHNSLPPPLVYRKGTTFPTGMAAKIWDHWLF